ncbi:hypothetical protein [Bartonella sp. HY406]|uniref:hypothetical protein n=1 Tax=Bartonella sp. HY406 TaxID=2979331 RepID=UPI0021CA0BAC|nr:hypothetical protein [Bartonella sp. HY406]UXN02693.1 hypothetical protein N6B01_09445 [Bartonella sp. HY406]
MKVKYLSLLPFIMAVSTLSSLGIGYGINNLKTYTLDSKIKDYMSFILVGEKYQ